MVNEIEALDEAAKAAGWRDWQDAYNQCIEDELNSIRAHATTLMENAALNAEVARKDEALVAAQREITALKDALAQAGGSFDD